MSTLRSLASRMASLLACRRSLYASISAMSSGYTLLMGASGRVLAARFWALRAARFWRRRAALPGLPGLADGVLAAAIFRSVAAGCSVAALGFSLTAAIFAATAGCSLMARFSALRASRFWRRRAARSGVSDGVLAAAGFSLAALFLATAGCLSTSVFSLMAAGRFSLLAALAALAAGVWAFRYAWMSSGVMWSVRMS